MRQQIWQGIDASRSDPVRGNEPGTGWASYALNAPVMLVRDGDRTTPVTRRVPFRAWLRGASPIDRRPTLADLDYHLTTLFPPVRPRGYVEIRCLDAVPDRWWPALAALTVTLIDDEVAADRAAELCEPIGDGWVAAARDGLADPRLRAAVEGCAEVAARRCPAPLQPEVEAYAELILSGRTPGERNAGPGGRCRPPRRPGRRSPCLTSTTATSSAHGRGSRVPAAGRWNSPRSTSRSSPASTAR